ncbi:MAG: hypothetical protein M1834_006013 [Cirrosporium novae-zelandiae]|nr:MAG: hypothetical protein M1834_006013 [Cirrosporium novae-zelandiae]
MTTNSELESKQPSVPKFSSFKPKPTASIQGTSSQAPSPGSSSRHRKQGESREKHQSKHKSHRLESDRRHRHESASPSIRSRLHHNSRRQSHDDSARQHKHRHHRDEKHTHMENTTPVIESWNKDPDPWVVDTKGDPANVNYGTTHRYSIPSFKRTGFGAILGLPDSLRIEKTSSTYGSLRVGYRVMEPKELDWDSLPTSELRVKASPNLNLQALENDRDFLDLEPRKRQRLNLTDVITDNSDKEIEIQDYRSIEHAMAQSHQPEDEDLEYATEGGTESVNSHFQQRNAELSKKTKLDPSDTDAWLDLINFQDNFLEPVSRKRKLTAAERKSTADIKISIYEQALGAVKDADGRERLLLGMMEEGTRVWEKHKISEKWRKALRENPNIWELWIGYINFQQSSSTTHTVQQYQNLFKKCLTELPSSSAQDSLRIYIFLRYTLMLREAGYPEYALATWQAILEYNFRRPVNTSQNLDKSFDQFWDSEVPRIGEIGAIGWNKWSFADHGITESSKDFSPSVTDCPNLFKEWIAWETAAIHHGRHPARTLDETNIDDIYRIVYSGDIKPFLFHISTQEAQLELVNSFLAFAHQPALPSSFGAATYYSDQFIFNEILGQSMETICNGWFPSSTDTTNKKGPQSAIRYFPTSVDSLFENQVPCFSSFRKWQDAPTSASGYLDIDFVELVLKDLLKCDALNQNAEFAQYFMAFEAINYPDKAEKLAKVISKNNKTSLAIYNAYALILSNRGRLENATRVWVRALNSSNEVPHPERLNRITLLRCWALRLLFGGDPTMALWALLVWGDFDFDEIIKEPRHFQDIKLGAVPSTTFLKAQKTYTRSLIHFTKVFEQGRDSMVSNGYYHLACQYTECLSLLYYLSHDRDLLVALQRMNETSTILHARNLSTSLPNELLHQSKARLMHYHMTQTKNFKPSTIRNELETSLSLFPTNTIFLSLHAWNESHLLIDDRIRAVMHNALLTTTKKNPTKQERNTSIIPSLFNIYTEINRPVARGSSVHASRAAIKRCISDPHFRHSPFLYILSFHYEQWLQNTNAAKSALYAGINQCPWLKQTYMLAFQHLRREIGFARLQELYRGMVEKEIRIRIDISDILDEHELEGDEEVVVTSGTTTATGATAGMAIKAERGSENNMLRDTDVRFTRGNLPDDVEVIMID